MRKKKKTSHLITVPLRYSDDELIAPLFGRMEDNSFVVKFTLRCSERSKSLCLDTRVSCFSGMEFPFVFSNFAAMGSIRISCYQPRAFHTNKINAWRAHKIQKLFHSTREWQKVKAISVYLKNVVGSTEENSGYELSEHSLICTQFVFIVYEVVMIL